jgi:hypothetical protein
MGIVHHIDIHSARYKARENNEIYNRHTLPTNIGRMILYVSQAGFELEATLAIVCLQEIMSRVTRKRTYGSLHSPSGPPRSLARS